MQPTQLSLLPDQLPAPLPDLIGLFPASQVEATMALLAVLIVARAAAGAAEAIPLHKQTLAAYERVLAPGPPLHPDLAEQPRRRLPGGGPGGLKPHMLPRRAARGF